VTGERRRDTRVLPAVRVAARIRTTVDAGILNLSRRGALIQTESPLVPGSTYELRLMTPGTEVRIPSRVRRCKIQLGGARTYHSGLEFQEVPEGGDQVLEGLVRKSKQGKPLSGVIKLSPEK
jgi:hypothetical protein